MGAVILGGLLSSTLRNMFVVPVLHPLRRCANPHRDSRRDLLVFVSFGSGAMLSEAIRSAVGAEKQLPSLPVLLRESRDPTRGLHHQRQLEADIRPFPFRSLEVPFEPLSNDGASLVERVPRRPEHGRNCGVRLLEVYVIRWAVAECRV